MRTKIWHVPHHAWPRVLDLAPRIQELADRAWADSFIKGAYLDGDDLKIAIPEARQASYQLNGLVTYEGVRYIVTHVGRPYLYSGRPVCNVYLVSDETEEAMFADPIELRGVTVPASAMDDAEGIHPVLLIDAPAQPESLEPEPKSDPRAARTPGADRNDLT